MISDIVIAELFVLLVLYFKYYGSVIFISYGILTRDMLKYQNLTAELEERLPGYQVHSGFYNPPNVICLGVILALLFRFQGLHNFIWRIVSRGKIIDFLIVAVSLAISMMSIKGFAISYESHCVYSRPTPETEIPSVDQLVDIIKKENKSGPTFPRAVVGATITYFTYVTFGPPRRRR